MRLSNRSVPCEVTLRVRGVLYPGTEEAHESRLLSHPEKHSPQKVPRVCGTILESVAPRLSSLLKSISYSDTTAPTSPPPPHDYRRWAIMVAPTAATATNPYDEPHHYNRARVKQAASAPATGRSKQRSAKAVEIERVNAILAKKLK